MKKQRFIRYRRAYYGEITATFCTFIACFTGNLLLLFGSALITALFHLTAKHLRHVRPML